MFDVSCLAILRKWTVLPATTTTATRLVGRLLTARRPSLLFLLSSSSSSSSFVASDQMVRVLNVAEKNDAAKSLADIMSRGRYNKREGLSRFNKIYEFPFNVFNQNCQMTMTSVSGHLLNYEFVGNYKKWYGCSPVALFDAPVQKKCLQDYTDILRTLEREARGCDVLIIWTDCDREGENIGFEVIGVCTAVKPSLKVYRARFSEITPQAVTRALNNLGMADRNVSEAVDVRQELDLRIGAAFTRFQTLRLKQVFPDVLADQLISYGSCQFPTLGFVVERYKQVQAFVPEPFWKIKVLHECDGEEVEFSWKRQRLFDYMACLILYEHCIENPIATVVDVVSKPKSKWRPVALDTVELEKLASRKLKINAKETMKIAEKLYTQGFISYPRTETNMFPKEFDLRTLVGHQTQDQNWGGFAAALLERGPTPRNGNKTDQAHPPIHPTKYTDQLQGNERRIYEFIVRHFLACCSQDAQGHETTVEIDINEERFSISGLMIIARNYLDVYPYDKWNAKVIPTFNKGDTFQPKCIEMNQSETSPPSLLTEADLIALMEKHGIGTDATHADHIETIKSRLYVGVRDDGKFVPGELGMGLVEGYDAMGYEMSKPNLRAELEQDLKRICEGQKNRDVVLVEQIQKYKQVFIEATRQASKLDQALSQFFGDARQVTGSDYQPEHSSSLCACPSCGQDMIIKTKKDGTGLFLSCMGFPDCRSVVWFPASVLEAVVDDSLCDMCTSHALHRVKFKFKPGSVPPFIPNEYLSCIGGCDPSLNEALGISFPRRPANASFAGSHGRNSDSGLGSSLSAEVSRDSENMSTVTTQNGFGASQGRNSSTRPSVHNSMARNGPGMLATRNVQPRENSSLQNAVRPLGAHDDNTVVCHCGQDAKLLTVRKEGPNTDINRWYFKSISKRPGHSRNQRVRNGEAELWRTCQFKLGRQFFACMKPPDSKCNFFLWADSADTNGNDGGLAGNSSLVAPRNSFVQPQQLSFPTNHGGNNDIRCACGNEANLKTVQKDGPNKGRQFYCCAKPFNQGQCSFFQWADGHTGPSNPASASHRNGDSNFGRGVGFGRGHAGNGGSSGHGRGIGYGRGSWKKPSADGSDGAPKKKRKCGLCGEEGHTKNKCPHK